MSESKGTKGNRAMTWPSSLNHRSSTMLRRRRAMVVVALSIVASFAVGGNVVTELAHGSADDASALPSMRALSAHIKHSSGASDMQTPLVTTKLASVGVPVHPLANRRVALYGDSLAWQARVEFSAALAEGGITQVTTRTFGGTAICDWLPQMRADQAHLRPNAVVIEFSGNAFTPCMKDPAGRPLSSPAYFMRYSDDARTVVAIFARDDALVYFAGSPIGRQAEQSHDQNVARLDHVYATIAATDLNTRYIDAGAAVLDHGHWTGTLPCLRKEPCSGGTDPSGRRVNVVRAPDGSHFCPSAPPAVLGVTDACPVYSSGAYRYATAMAAPVIVDLTSINGHCGCRKLRPKLSTGALAD
jgi:hypothetical protein